MTTGFEPVASGLRIAVTHTHTHTHTHTQTHTHTDTHTLTHLYYTRHQLLCCALGEVCALWAKPGKWKINPTTELNNFLSKNFFDGK